MGRLTAKPRGKKSAQVNNEQHLWNFQPHRREREQINHANPNNDDYVLGNVNNDDEDDFFRRMNEDNDHGYVPGNVNSNHDDDDFDSRSVMTQVRRRPRQLLLENNQWIEWVKNADVGDYQGKEDSDSIPDTDLHIQPFVSDIPISWFNQMVQQATDNIYQMANTIQIGNLETTWETVNDEMPNMRIDVTYGPFDYRRTYPIPGQLYEHEDLTCGGRYKVEDEDFYNYIYAIVARMRTFFFAEPPEWRFDFIRQNDILMFMANTNLFSNSRYIVFEAADDGNTIAATARVPFTNDDRMEEVETFFTDDFPFFIDPRFTTEQKSDIAAEYAVFLNRNFYVFMRERAEQLRQQREEEEMPDLDPSALNPMPDMTDQRFTDDDDMPPLEYMPPRNP